MSEVQLQQQQQQECVAVDLGGLLDAGPGAVVTLVAGETELVVHRAVLVTGSPVFAATFAHDMQEASSNCVQINDVEGPVLRQLAAFLYSGRAPQLPSMAPQLLAAADKYDVVALRVLCEQQLQRGLTVQSAAVTAALAARHSCMRLLDSATAFMREHVSEVMGTEGWAEAVRCYPEEVIEVTRRVAAPPAETRLPALSDRRQTRRGLGQTPAAAAPPDEAAVSRYRNMSAGGKGRRLVQAATQGAVDKLRALLAAGADLEATEEFGFTALHKAALEGHEETVGCLLQAGAQVDARSRLQWTPLHRAAVWGHTAVVQLLVAAGADPNSRNEGGWRPLHYAAAYGRAEVATVLLEAGADRAATDSRGRTPLDIARLHNKQQLVDILS